MRTRERLVLLLRSVNPLVYSGAAMVMTDAAEHLDGEQAECCVACANNMAVLAAYHESPHIRELAAQTAIYLQGVTVQ